MRFFSIPAVLLATVAAMANAQEILHGPGPDGRPILFNGDTVVLDGGEQRKDLDCTVTPEKAVLGFDLKFHAGYSVSLPLRELQGPGNKLSILFRVDRGDAAQPAVYLAQRVRVPPIAENSGDVSLEGGFDVGEGSYHVAWLMRDNSGRYCSSQWDIDAALAPKDKDITVAVPPLSVRRSEDEQFQPEPPVERAGDDAALKVKILMNFAPDQPNAATLKPQDRVALMSILRNLSRNPQIGKISLVAFNIQQERVLYRQNASDQIDFPSMGRALTHLSLGTVEVRQLENKHGDTEFLSSLIRDETAGGAPDGLVFVGPKSLIDASVPQEDLKGIGTLDYPVFYMNYTPDPVAVPWRDAIGRMVKFFKGREYTISGPRDLWNAVGEVVSRIAKSKQAHLGGVSTAANPR